MSAPDIDVVTRRTHNYLRLSLVGVVVVLLVAVVVESIRIHELLPTISHYYYTPARNVLVGSLIAASVAMLALSGRNIEATLLDIAAPLAPLIALVPTPILAGDVPGLDPGCAQPCVPQDAQHDIANGVTVYLVALGAALVVGIVIWFRDGPRRVGVGIALLAGLATGIALVVATITGFPHAHFAASGLFVLLFATVPLVNVFSRTSTREPSRAERGVYLAVAAALIVALGIGVYGLLVHDVGWPAIFWAEALALIAFAVFWLVQTIARWNETDPPSLAVDRARMER